MKNCVIIAFCLLLFRYVRCTCIYYSLKEHISVYGTVRRYCEYKKTYHNGEDPYDVTLPLMPGSSFETLDCTVCTCTESMFKCCGYGIESRQFYTPRGCKVKADGCKALFVLEADETLDCFTKLPIKQTRMIHRVNAFLENRRKQGSTTPPPEAEEGAAPTTQVTISPFDINAAPANMLFNSKPNQFPFQGPFHPINGPINGPVDPNAANGHGGGGEEEGGPVTTTAHPFGLFPGNNMFAKDFHQPGLYDHILNPKSNGVNPYLYPDPHNSNGGNPYLYPYFKNHPNSLHNNGHNGGHNNGHGNGAAASEDK